ncbi:MAG TPA: hypothetical protein VGK28_04760 [Candidatus Dormibacteraeota bacterium]
MAPASHGLLGRIQRANADSANRFGAHTAEVESFIAASAQLTPWQWRQVLLSRQLVGQVTKEGSASPDSARSIQAAIRSTETRISEPMARAGEVLFDTLAKKSDDKQVAAWQAMTALVMRSQLPALKFAVHYAPFAAVVPLSGADVLEPKTRRYIAGLRGLTKEHILKLASRWRIEPGASRTLLQAVAKNRHVKSEEAVAVAALVLIPQLVTGDEGWSAVRTLVHGGRVLGCLDDLSPEDIRELWAPLETVIPFESLNRNEEEVPGSGLRSAVGQAIKKTMTRPPRSRVAAPAATRAPAAYGPNHAEVAAFVKGVAELSPIQWLRVIDRRKLVSSVTREGAAEPAGVVRSILAALEGTRELDMYTRCRAFAAVERAGFAIESRGHRDLEEIRPVLAPFDSSVAFEDLNGGGFAHKVAALGNADWHRVAAAVADTNAEAVAPLVNAGTALIDFFGGRSDDEAVATWHAVAALVHRHQLPPIKFAASYAPFASAIPVTNPRSLGALVSRYVTAVGRLGASQCALLARQWQLSEELSGVLSRAVADGGSRAGEEAAALSAVVTVPMRLAGTGGWAAVKTAAFGGKVIAARTRLTAEQLELLWEPLQPAIPLSSLNAPARVRR